MKELTSRPPDQYAYRQLPSHVDTKRFPFMPFKDKQSIVVDVKALAKYLDEQAAAKQNEPAAQPAAAAPGTTARLSHGKSQKRSV
jgi:hypothetical protein